ncbi:MAG: type I-B CRISPR-associated protein Cas7/Csh2 [Candidatus Aenigmarchaeota archaeon]|nr:type I-B CRISPR-associated protein Cas7/Csh2 [Candidatus Aenigmarchaeota archaeon]
MSNIIKNRSEILFLYDVTYANPNGDPMEENKPRIDEETGINIVTDVRLKRTMRDYFLTLIESGDIRFKEQDVFIKEIVKEDGTQKTREERIEELKIKNKEDEKKLLEKYIDLRLFGATIALKGKARDEKGRSITWTGPVQFRFGRSLHRVVIDTLPGTTVMPSKEEVTRGTFIETHVVPYSLICFYGIINENAARTTGLTENDVGLLIEGMWNGTKNLITRSKAGQMPRFLMRVVYKEKNFHIGDLDKMIKLRTTMDEEKVRDISEVKIDISELVSILRKYKDKIEKVEFKSDDRTVFLINEEEVSSTELKERFKEGTGLNNNQIIELKI